MRGEYAVVVAGGGPTGLMLAGELALAGVEVVIVERRADQRVPGRRAGGLHVRTMEVLDQRGVLEPFAEAGTAHPALMFSDTLLPLAELPSRHNHLLALPQEDFERILAEWVLGELRVPILRETEVLGCVAHDAGVEVQLSSGTLRARYLAGCDGGRSAVRKAAGIDFVGEEPSTSWMIAEVEMDEAPPLGFRTDAAGTHALGPAPDGGITVLVMEPEVRRARDIAIDELRAAVRGVYGTDFGLRRARWISRFTDATRQASSYRRGRVLLAGDAAHVHPPHGGQGLNTGVQDAVNLGWKLGLVLGGHAPESLLDSYHAERHPVGARVIRTTLAQVALKTPGARHEALRDTLSEVLELPAAKARLAALLSGLDIRYALGEGHPLVGRRMPDLDLDGGEGCVYAHLHRARTLLLDLDGSDGGDLSPWGDRVERVRARSASRCALPGLGEVDLPPAVLVRPDGYVAWAGAMHEPGLPEALTAWCGPGA